MALAYAAVSPTAAGCVNAWAGRYGERGALREFVMEHLRCVAPGAVPLATLHKLVIARFALNLRTPRERANLRRTLSTLMQHQNGTYQYKLAALPAYAEFAGRLFVTFARTRASYLRGESCAPRMTVHAVTAEPVKLDEFPGFKTVDISFEDLDYLVRSGTTSWRTALGSVAGVYLISDTLTGKLYVGSATGEGGIWGRWCQYVDGHGHNVELKKLVGTEGIERAKHYRFSVLEIADTHASSGEVLERESHWKRVLLTRIHGWNAN